MTFAEFYKKSKQGFVMEKQLPADVKEDLMKHLAKNDGTIGVYVYHNHVLNEETNTIEFEGMKMGYYLRTWKPILRIEMHKWFWRHNATYGNE